ncbi:MULTISPECIES: 50S ribosomal protein L17 [unclassified Candidatus Cardinium]|uniref:50S ribosomal protein L17 n=1 Tax=unclassified Candidatus Cardinium TaxID=2641185 RepID=UPI001FB47C4B|nr:MULTISPECIES: 50S ribosomal protein L17 [unclassified Candidatus Cardinium]
MRHRNKINRLGRPAGHRKALLMNLAKSLIMHKRIVTTLAKGKVLRTFIEPILTRAKQDTTHSRRMVFSHFQDKEPVKELFNQIAEKIEQRPGGYTRVIKLPNRAGDNAAMCMIELVDYNDIYTKEAKVVKTTRRRRKKTPSTSSVEEVGRESVAETVLEVAAD